MVALPSVVGLTVLGGFPSMTCLLVAAYFSQRALASRAQTDALAARVLAAGIAVGVDPARARSSSRPPSLRSRSGAADASWSRSRLGSRPRSSRSHSGATGASATWSTQHLGRSLHFNWTDFNGNLDGFRKWGWSKRLVEWAALAGLIGLVRRSLAGAVLVGGWFAAELLANAGDPGTSVSTGKFLLQMIPALPAFVLLVTCVVFCVPVAGRRPLASGEGLSWPRRERSQRGLVALLAFIAVVPIGVFLILPPLSRPDAARRRRPPSPTRRSTFRSPSGRDWRARRHGGVRPGQPRPALGVCGERGRGAELAGAVNPWYTGELRRVSSSA